MGTVKETARAGRGEKQSLARQRLEQSLDTGAGMHIVCHLLSSLRSAHLCPGSVIPYPTRYIRKIQIQTLGKCIVS